MRGAAFLLAALPVFAVAQGPVFSISSVAQSLKDRVRNGNSPNPLAAPVNPPLSAQRKGDLPAPVPNSKTFRILKAGTTDFNGDYVHLTGGTEFVYQGYHTFADEAEGNLTTGVFSLRRNVEVYGSDMVIKGEQVNVDYKRRTYSGRDARVVLDPKLLGGRFRDDLYTRGGAGFGRSGEQETFNGELTTCSYDDPHYEIVARRSDVRPGKRILLYDAKLRFFNHTLLQVPFLSLPLDDRTNRYTPELGQNQDEGYYIKNYFGVPISGQDNDLRARVDYMTKLGNGLGGDYFYRNPTLGGVFRLYTIAQIGEVVLQSQHRQRFRWGDFSLNNNYQRNNYLTAPGSSLLNTQALLNVPWGGGQSSLNYSRTGSQYATSTTETQNYAFSDSRLIGTKFNTQADVNYNSSASSYTGSSFSTQQMDVRFKGTDDFKIASANLDYQRTIPVGDNPNFFGGADRTPVLSLQSDSTRLIGQQFGRSWPIRTELSLGQFGDPTGDRVTRDYFSLDFNKNDRASKRFRADFNGRFQQGMYSDGTAQYVLGSGAAFSYKLGRDTAANIRYNYLRPEGFTPLSLDSTGQSHVATSDVTVRPQRYLLFGGQTGYDFLRVKSSDVGWQQVGLRSEFTPARFFNLRSLATYDTFNGIWSSVRLDLNYRPGATLLTVGARYDGFQKTWSNANVYLNNLKIGRTRFSAVLNYNGLTKQFDATQYNFVYDLHCWEMLLTVAEYKTGFRPGREIQLLFRLKALPFDGVFGIGRRGQPLGTSTGRDF
ncbi:hypothetical protein BH11ARM2_BH11ARM2_17320 [soil metagenome]